MAMSNIHLYSDDVLYNVRSVLCHVLDNGGRASTRFWQQEAQRLQGEWGTDVVNIARQAMGREGLLFQGKASEKQMEIFVRRAKQSNEDVLRKIAAMREGQNTVSSPIPPLGPDDLPELTTQEIAEIEEDERRKREAEER
jgi:hypothetical protein